MQTTKKVTFHPIVLVHHYYKTMVDKKNEKKTTANMSFTSKQRPSSTIFTTAEVHYQRPCNHMHHRFPGIRPASRIQHLERTIIPDVFQKTSLQKISTIHFIPAKGGSR